MATLYMMKLAMNWVLEWYEKIVIFSHKTFFIVIFSRYILDYIVNNKKSYLVKSCVINGPVL